MLLPISLVFAMISTKIFLVRSNALVSFYSLGYSKADILRPFVVVALLVIGFFISLHFSSSFAKADEFSNNIKNNAEYLSPTRDLLFTYEKQFIYFSKMLPAQNRAEGIRIFNVDGTVLKEVLVASAASYKDGFWHIDEADIIVKPVDFTLSSKGMKLIKKRDLKILKGFRPKMLDQVYEGKINFTISEAIEGYLLLKKQEISTVSIEGALYKIFIYPLFAPCLIVIIFFFVPISTRFLNLSLFSFVAILTTLLVWGVLFMLSELANNKTITNEIGIILPIFILFIIALRQYLGSRIST